MQRNSQSHLSHRSPGSPVAPRSWRSCLRLSLFQPSIELQGQTGWRASPPCPLKPILVQLLIKAPLPPAPPAPQQQRGYTSVSSGEYWSPGAQLTPCARSGRKPCPAVCSLSSPHPKGSFVGWTVQVKTQPLFQSGSWKELCFLRK